MINQKEIAATLCIKKAIKNNGCNGKCYLAKQLKKAAEKEKKEAELLKEKQEVFYPISDIAINIPTNIIKLQKRKIYFSENSKTKSIITSLFRPPLV